MPCCEKAFGVIYCFHRYLDPGDGFQMQNSRHCWDHFISSSILICLVNIQNKEYLNSPSSYHWWIFLNWFSLQSTNEESLKHLSAYLEALQTQQMLSTSPRFISFYVRDKENARDSFKMIRIALEQKTDIKQFLKHIFKTCNLPTENVEKIQSTPRSSKIKFSSEDRQHGDAPIFDEYEMYAQTMRVKQAKTLK